MTLKEVTQKIVDLLKADQQLGIPPQNIFFGPPLARNISPFAYVEWNGGPVRIEAFGHELWLHEWSIYIFEAAQLDDVAEKNVLEKAERAREVLRRNPTLDGLVRDSRVIHMEGECITIGTELKASQVLAAARLVLQCEVGKTV